MPVNKPHLEFHAVGMTSGWATPEGYPEGIEQKILAGALAAAALAIAADLGLRGAERAVRA